MTLTYISVSSGSTATDSNLGVIRTIAGTPARALLILLLLSQISLADGVIRDGIGAKSIGRGGTNIAHADNTTLLLDNPAGLSNLAGEGLVEFSVDLLLTDLRYSDADNARANAANNPFPVGEFGLAYKLPNSDFTAGFGVISHAGFAAQYDLNGPAPLSGIRNYKSIGAVARILPGLACRLTDRMSIGASFGVAVGHIELEGPYFLQGPNAFRGTPTMLDLQSTGAAPSASFGLQYQLTPATVLGLSYTEETRFKMGGNTLVDIPGLGAARFDSRLDVTWPRFLGLGIKHNLCDCRTISTDVIWYDWSKAFNSMTLNLSDPDNAAIGAVTGQSLTERLPLGWSDSISIRTGFEQKFRSGRTIRGGYVYHRNPIPSETQTAYIQAILEHAVSVGASQETAIGTVDLAYQFSFGPDQAVGTSSLVGGDFSQSNSFARAHWIALGVQRRW